MILCSSVLNQCQDYTFSDGAYVQNNQVIKNWLERVSIQIKSAQDTILSDYAEECLSDVVSCLASNGYDETKQANTTRNNIAMNACNSLITTCMSVNGVTGDNGIETINRASWISFLTSDDDLAAENMAKFNACIDSYGSYVIKSDGTGSCTCLADNDLTLDDTKTFCVCTDENKVYDPVSGDCHTTGE